MATNTTEYTERIKLEANDINLNQGVEENDGIVNLHKIRGLKSEPILSEAERLRSLELIAPPECNNPYKGKKFHKCNICGRRYWNHDEHMLTHDRDHEFKCILCDKCFKSNAALKRHRIMHRNILNRKYPCTECNLAFSSNRLLKTHQKAHLKKHASTPAAKPSNKQLPTCDICGKKRQDILGHMAEHAQEFECDICHNTFKKKLRLKWHMDMHVNARKYQCSKCPRNFNYRNLLRRHMESHLTYCPVVCHICGAAFKYRNSLRVHVRSHTGERPFQCDRCDKSFATNSSLRLHLRVHTGEKPYVCDICGRGFADGSTMKIHKRVHTGENPYICHLCGKSTKQASNLKSHYKHFHKIHDITGKTIRKNARIFAQHNTESLTETNLMEILNQAAMVEAIKEVKKNVETDTTETVVPIPGKFIPPTQSIIPIADIDDDDDDEEDDQDDSDEDEHNDDRNDGHDDYSSSDEKPLISAKELLSSPFIPIIKMDSDNEHSTVPTCIKQEFPNSYPLETRIKTEINEIDRETRSTNINSNKVIVNSVRPKIEEITINERTEEIFVEGTIKSEEPVSIDDFSWFNSAQNVIQYSLEEFKKPPKPSNVKKVSFRKVAKGKKRIKKPQKSIKKNTKKAQIESDDDTNADVINDDIESADIEQIDENEKDKKVVAPTKGAKFQKCTICNRRYMNHDEHMRIHTHEKPYECDICHKTFKFKDYLKLHKRLHTQTKNIICEQCGAAFYHTHDLRRHLKRHSDDRPFECKQCGKRFKENFGLKKHQLTHTGLKPHQCKICDKTFSSTMGLKLHTRTHTGEKPYKCDYCDSRFGDASTHRQHVRIHTGERPYRCHICGKGTTQAGNLKSHLRHYHKLIVKHVQMASTKYL